MHEKKRQRIEGLVKRYKNEKAEPATYRLAKNPYLVQSLDISTGHLTQKEVALLEEATAGQSDNPVVAYKYEYGYLVYVPDEKADYLAIAEYGYERQFRDILRRARELKCKYVKFDGDGITYEDLETYNW
jgi:hypothetical protein